MPPAWTSLFPRLPADQRAQSLTLDHPDRPFQAWIAFADASDLQPPATALAAFLDDSEHAQASAFQFPRRRKAFLLGRLAAKLALAPFLSETDRTKIRLTRGVFGQPLVEYPLLHHAEITLSHTESFAVALAFPRAHPMGIDLETIDPGRAETIKSELKFSPAEKQWLHSSAVEPSSAYVMLWTIREALGKALRTGLTCPPELLAAGSLTHLAPACWESHSKNFAQYKCLSWLHENQAFSIALPKATEMSLARSKTAR